VLPFGVIKNINNIHIAALSETRIHGESQFDEVAAGYTFLLIGHPSNGPSQDGALSFAIRSSLLKHAESRPISHKQSEIDVLGH